MRTPPQPVPGLSLRVGHADGGAGHAGAGPVLAAARRPAGAAIQRGCDLYTRNFLDYWNLCAVDALETGRNAFTTGNTDWASPLWCTNGQSVAKVLGSLSLSSALSEDPAESAEDSTQEGDTPPYPLSRPCCLSRPTAICRMRMPPTQFRRQYSSHPAAPPALPTIPTPAPTG